MLFCSPLHSNNSPRRSGWKLHKLGHRSTLQVLHFLTPKPNQTIQLQHNGIEVPFHLLAFYALLELLTEMVANE